MIFEGNKILSEDTLKTVQGALGNLVEKAKEFGKSLSPMLIALYDKIVAMAKDLAKFNTFGLETEVLTKQQLVDFIKRYIAKGSNQSVLVKSATEDGIFVYVSFARDRELLPDSDNKYLIIKAKTLAPEVAELFGENELIILE